MGTEPSTLTTTGLETESEAIAASAVGLMNPEKVTEKMEGLKTSFSLCSVHLHLNSHVGQGLPYWTKI